MRNLAWSRWVLALALPALAGCAGNSMVMKGQLDKTRDEQVALTRQKEELQNRANRLDRDNQDLVGDEVVFGIGTQDDPSGLVLVHEIVGDNYVARKVPEVDTEPLITVGDVVPDVTARVAVIDPMHAVAGLRGMKVANVVDPQYSVACAVDRKYLPKR